MLETVRLGDRRPALFAQLWERSFTVCATADVSWGDYLAAPFLSGTALAAELARARQKRRAVLRVNASMLDALRPLLPGTSSDELVRICRTLIGDESHGTPPGLPYEISRTRTAVGMTVWVHPSFTPKPSPGDRLTDHLASLEPVLGDCSLSEWIVLRDDQAPRLLRMLERAQRLSDSRVPMFRDRGGSRLPDLERQAAALIESADRIARQVLDAEDRLIAATTAQAVRRAAPHTRGEPV